MCVHCEHESPFSTGLIFKGENCRELEGLPVYSRTSAIFLSQSQKTGNVYVWGRTNPF